MSRTYTPAQKRAYAIKMAVARKEASKSVGRGRKTTYNKKPMAMIPVYRTIKGRGGYAEDWAKTGSEWGGKFGGLAGGVADLATSVAGKVGPMLDGLGAYKVKKNSLIKIGEGNSPPVVMNAKDGRFIIRHREYLRDIIVPANNNGAFVCTPFKINPGLQSTFPWLSTVAQNFQQYRMRGMLFQFKSNYSEYNSAQAGMGTIILATEYDATLPVFTSKVVMENHQYAMSAKPSKSQLHPIECARDATPLTELYIRQTIPDDNNDLRFSDFGTFQIAYAGIPNSTDPINLGELWVTYEMELLKPQMAGSGALLLSSYFTNSSGIGAGAIFGTLTTMQADPNNEIAANFSYGTNNCTITLNDNIGQCRVLFAVTQAFNSLGARTSFSVAAVENCTIPTPVWGNQANFQAPGVGESSTRQTWMTYIDCTGGGKAKFTFSQTSPTGVLQVYLTFTTYESLIGTEALVPYESFSDFTPMQMEFPTMGDYINTSLSIEDEEDEEDEKDEKDEKDEVKPSKEVYLAGNYTIEDLKKLVEMKTQK